MMWLSTALPSLAALAAAPISATTPTVLVIRLPSIPNPPARHRDAGLLYRGTWRWVGPKGVPFPVDPVQALSKAALNCGQRQFRWRGLNTDHGSEMLLAAGSGARRGLRCMAKRVSFDFYVRVERYR